MERLAGSLLRNFVNYRPKKFFFIKLTQVDEESTSGYNISDTQTMLLLMLSPLHQTFSNEATFLILSLKKVTRTRPLFRRRRQIKQIVRKRRRVVDNTFRLGGKLRCRRCRCDVPRRQSHRRRNWRSRRLRRLVAPHRRRRVRRLQDFVRPEPNTQLGRG